MEIKELRSAHVWGAAAGRCEGGDGPSGLTEEGEFINHMSNC
jgi:hypothetical protein